MPELTSKSKRESVINHVLSDLREFKSKNPDFDRYPIEENIVFFEAIKSVWSYVSWLIQKAPKLDGSRLLELTDFPFPRWDREMHLKLIEVERRDFPGLITPLVNRLAECVAEKKEGPFIGVNLGCGGMEVDRQLIKKIIGGNYGRQVILIGIDKSAVAHELAKENLREMEHLVSVHEVGELNSAILNQLMKAEQKLHMIILAKNDIFTMPHHFSPQSFDAMYHALFKHHLNASQKEKLDSLATLLSKKTLEYDGYKSWPVIIPQTLTGWRYPIFFNAEIFSNFRFLEKNKLIAISHDKKLVFYSRIGMYLME